MEIRKEITARFGFIYFAAAIFGIVIVAKIFMIQNMDTDKWRGIAKDLKNNTTEIEAKRGNICADDGSILATSVPKYELRLDLAAPRIKRVYDEKADAFALEVAEFFGISKYQFKLKLDKDFKKGNRWFLIYPEEVNYNQLQRFKRLSTMNRGIFGSGLIVVTENERVMPHSELASRTIGTLNKGAYGGIHGNVGYSGIEGLMEGYLSGENGKAVKRNYSGRWINVPIIEPNDGSDVVTTLNVNLQDFANNALFRQMETSQAEWGTAIVMEVKTGEVKAIANLGRRKDGAYAETYNFALGHAGCSEPGSTFKLMSMMVAMEQGYVDTADVFDTGNGAWDYRGQTIYDSDYHHGGHGKLTMKEIFELSSNVGVAKIITKYYEGHEEDFIDRIYNFGLNKPLGLGFAGEGIPYIKYPDDKVWWGPSLAWISYGYEIKLTPLQTATFYNAVANNGRMVKPKFVKEVRRNGILEKEFKTEVINPSICSKQTLKKAQALLEGVCVDGTGKSLNNPYFAIAGKTGTAQVAYNNEGYSKGGRKNYQASFAGYFPADDPQYTCVVVIVGPKGTYYGSSVAGPVFKEIVSKVYASFMDPREKEMNQIAALPIVKASFKDEIEITANELDLPMEAKVDSKLIKINQGTEELSAEALAVAEGLVPDVRGMGGSDALYLLENAGLKVKMKGIGRVKKQSLKAGNKIRKGQTIYIDLG
ncbi:penicillin-binding protein [uncultured Sunxiuqinia sp.]|uniref:penicillin-binding protein n=1 Tax=uncultured Sunxiuqinia sp. TaxID=1573825 RepID=UPI002AA7EE63|nr:penicillin-binding protein [uncultured Sunxiuqinia sp.]